MMMDLTSEVVERAADGSLRFSSLNAARHGELEGRRPNGFLGLSLNDRTIIFLVILVDKTVSVG